MHKEVIKKVRKIEIKTRHLVDGLLQGAYHSIFRGRGIEFSEVREYQIGDDIRSIDWNVTARMNHPFVKEFIEERELTVYMVVDASGSNIFGSEKSKKDAATELAASLMFAALRNNDKVGLCLFTKGVEKYIPPRKGKKHVLRLIRELVYFNPANKGTNIEETLIFLSKVIKKRSIIFIISDFFTEISFEKPLQILKNRNDIIAISLNDIREENMPDIGYIELEDEETGEQILLDTSDKGFRRRYAGLIEERKSRLRSALNRLKIDIIEVKSNEQFEKPLRKFFKLRKKRRV